MLAIAGQKIAALSEETRRRIELVEGDMTAFALGRQFRLVMIPYRAFLHLMTPEDQRQALACARDHLADGGRLVLNIFDPRLEIITRELRALGPALRKHAELTDPATGNRVVVWTADRYDPENQTVKQDRIYEELDGEGRVVARRYGALNLRYIFRYEMQHLLELCGYRVEALYGDFRRGPFRYGGEQVWVAQKR